MSHIEEGMTTVAHPPKKGYRTIRLPLAESEYDRFLLDRSYAKVSMARGEVLTNTAAPTLTTICGIQV